MPELSRAEGVGLNDRLGIRPVLPPVHPRLAHFAVLEILLADECRFSLKEERLCSCHPIGSRRIGSVAFVEEDVLGSDLPASVQLHIVRIQMSNERLRKSAVSAQLQYFVGAKSIAPEVDANQLFLCWVELNVRFDTGRAAT